jgi:hypothetical protein
MLLRNLTEPPLRHLPPYLKLLSLFLLMTGCFLVFFAIGMGLSIPIFGSNVVDSLDMDADFADRGTIAALKFFQVVNQLGVFVVPGILFVFLVNGSVKGYLRLNTRIHRISVIFGSLLVILSLPFNSWLLEMNQAMHLPAFLEGVEDWMRRNEDNATRLTEAFLGTGGIGGLLVNLLMIGVIAAVGEELIFRGILIRLFREWTRNTHVAVLVSSLLFSALHLQFFGFIPRMVLGIILGYLFVWSGSLWVPILVHFINNATAVTVSYLGNHGIVNSDLENFGTSDNPWIIGGSFFLSAFIFFMVYYHERVFNPGQWGKQ